MIKLSDTGIYRLTDDPADVVRAANRIGHPKVGENFYDHLDKLTSKGTA